MRASLKGLALVAAFVVGAGSAFAQSCPSKIRIGVEGAYPPFSEVTPEGQLKGFDIDIALALCKSLAAECTLVQQDWDGIIPALIAKKYDAILASMSITEERKKKVDFTNKYYQTPGRFVVAKSSDLQITPEGLKGKKVGVQRATIYDSYITEKFPGVEVVRYGTQDEVYLDMKAGRLDAIVQDSVAASDGFLKQDGGDGFEFRGDPLNDPKYWGEGAGIAVRKGDDVLRECFNKAIQDIRADGTYTAIQSKYFDFDIYGG